MLTFDQQVPVTMAVTARVNPGRSGQFEEWLHAVASDAMKFEGHMGVNVIRPHSKP